VIARGRRGLQSTVMTEGPARLLFGPTGRVVLALGLVLCAASRFLLRLFS